MGHTTHLFRRFPMKSCSPIKAKTLRQNTVRIITSDSFFTDWIRAPTMVFRPEGREPPESESSHSPPHLPQPPRSATALSLPHRAAHEARPLHHLHHGSNSGAAVLSILPGASIFKSIFFWKRKSLLQHVALFFLEALPCLWLLLSDSDESRSYLPQCCHTCCSLCPERFLPFSCPSCLFPIHPPLSLKEQFPQKAFPDFTTLLPPLLLLF